MESGEVLQFLKDTCPSLCWDIEDIDGVVLITASFSADDKMCFKRFNLDLLVASKNVLSYIAHNIFCELVGLHLDEKDSK